MTMHQAATSGSDIGKLRAVVSQDSTRRVQRTYLYDHLGHIHSSLLSSAALASLSVSTLCSSDQSHVSAHPESLSRSLQSSPLFWMLAEERTVELRGQNTCQLHQEFPLRALLAAGNRCHL
jgi:hypothetical protein